MKVVMKLSKLLGCPGFTDEQRDGIADAVKEYGLDADSAELKRAPTSEPAHTNLEEKTALQYVSTRDVDREGDVLLPGGANLTEFRKAPQVLWGHDYMSPPIGSDKRIASDGKGLLALTHYADTDRANEVWSLKKGGHLRTSSVGFVPLEAIRSEDSGFLKIMDRLRGEWPELAKTADKVGQFIIKWLLLEHSDVSVPANPHALIVAMGKGLSLSDYMIKELGIKLPDPEDPKPNEKGQKAEPKIIQATRPVIRLVSRAVVPKVVSAGEETKKAVKEALDEFTGKV